MFINPITIIMWCVVAHTWKLARDELKRMRNEKEEKEKEKSTRNRD